MNVRGMVRDALAGKWIGLIADQNAGPHALPVTFLGQRTTMIEGPAALALILLFWLLRNLPGFAVLAP